ncbi:IclR family transcriptional regulator [Arthrobacter sp. efr-133-TYG-104]|uniref:IclR family transcriptional regulator n=1 Tax=Arthrobacter sp. efr-133-TYG-104 TaxID=3040324 RepID=UPI00254DC2DE|nr:IclR family transcriptional regulator [Arthrobacter sp. efr-133-TYG-104]
MSGAHDDTSSMLEKSMRIMQAFRRSEGSLRFSEIVARTGMPKSTTHRLIKALVELEMLAEHDGRFSIGMAAFEIGDLVPVRGELRDAAVPFMRDLFQGTNKAVHLGVRDGLEVVYVEKFGSGQDTDFPSRIGGRLPMTCTAVGKVLLAYATTDVIEEVLSRPLRRLTSRSITDPKVLRGQLPEIRIVGFATECEEAAVGGACVAAPILVHGRIRAALSVSVSADEFVPSRLSAAVKTAAAGITRELSRYDLSRPV